MPYLQTLINKSHLAKKHIEIVCMFLDCELFITELFALAYFTCKVSLPLLNFLEISSQPDLLKLFPQLYVDLVDGKMDTLREFLVEYRHIQIANPTSDTESLLLEKTRTQAAKALLLQGGREHGFGETAEIARATLPAEEIKQLPTNNIDSEKVFSVFDQKAVASSRCRNYKFKVKSIQNDLMLHKSVMTIPDKKPKQLFKLLNQREDDWNKQQNILTDKKILEKLKKANNQSIYTNNLLQTCKSWGGSVTSTDELDDILRAHGDLAKKIMAFY